MLIEIEHRMQFSYDDFIRDSQMEIRVEPQTLAHQAVHSFQLTSGPHASVGRYIDWNDNWVHHLSIRDYHNRIEILARSLVDSQPNDAGLGPLDAADPSPPISSQPDFIRMEGPVDAAPALVELAAKLPLGADAPLGRQVAAMGDLLASELVYQPGVTTWRSNVAEVLSHKTGVCQDFTHVALALLRLRGIPCRYVSGYLHVETEAAQSHAWIEVFGESCGWIAFDPTHQRIPDENYVTIATGRSYNDVAPNRGVYRGIASETLAATVHTKQAASIDFAQLNRPVAAIEVPVYTEIPDSAKTVAPRSGQASDSEREQQQQQQQQ